MNNNFLINFIILINIFLMFFFLDFTKNNFVSLTLARNERMQNVLTHASFNFK